MKTFPMFLQMAGRRVVIVGGGEQAAQKARLILKSEATVMVWAPDLDPELQGLAAEGRIHHETGPITTATFAGSALTFIATGCPGIDMALHAIAKDAGATVNVVDQPDLCDAITPSIVDRDPVTIAIGTEGAAPVLARAIKADLEARLPCWPARSRHGSRKRLNPALAIWQPLQAVCAGPPQHGWARARAATCGGGCLTTPRASCSPAVQNAKPPS